VIGLIGGIGSGKSRVAGLLAEQGAFVVDADTVGHALLDQRPVRDLVVGRFGKQILASPPAEKDGSDDEPAPMPAPAIDRRVLGKIVFNDRGALRQLESILHPRMRRTFERAIARTIRQGRARGVVLDAAILLEAGWDTLCDRVVFVEAPRDQRVARLAEARGWTDEMLTARESAQWPLDRKRAQADAVVVNDAGPDALEEEVRRIGALLLSPARTTPPGANRAGPGPSADPGWGRRADVSRKR
jgi:dephospho-CoA kinase